MLEQHVIDNYQWYLVNIMYHYPDTHIQTVAKMYLEQAGTAGGKHILRQELINFILY